jgi:acyl carrier protein
MDNGNHSPHTRVIAVIQRLITERSVAVGRSIRHDHKLTEIGLTSLDVVRLVLLIEDEFDLVIPEREITPANFRSISTISELVDKLSVSDSDKA